MRDLSELNGWAVVVATVAAWVLGGMWSALLEGAHFAAPGNPLGEVQPPPLVTF